jgi:hypothetical protein
MSWEQQQFRAWSREKREDHLAGLRKEMEGLRKAREEIVSKAANELKIWRYNSDITQLNWRLKYLKNFETKPALITREPGLS